ncbi:MAG: hypothetical protein ACJ8F7_06310 [Gemmataceae bacterium]
MLFRRWLLLALPLLATSARGAPPPPDQFLPNNTVAALMTTDAAGFVKAWEKTEFSALGREPLLQPFIQDVDAQWRRGLVLFDQLGLNWEDLKGMASGPAGVAVLRPAPDRVVLVGVVDTTGTGRARNLVVAKIARNVLRHGGTAKQQTVLKFPVTVFSLPAPGSSHAVSLCLYTREDLLILADDISAVEAVLSRWDRGHDSLADAKSYQEVRKRSAFADGRPVHLTLFADPAGMVEARHIWAPPKKPGPDILTMLGEEGFVGIQAVGATVRLNDGPFDQLARASVYAPPPYTRAMAAMNFPNHQLAGPEPWVPADLARCVTFTWDTRDLLTAIGFLFDRVTHKPGDFTAIVEALRDDPDGPRVDLQRQVLGRLTGKVTLVSDCPAEVPDRGERALLAFEARDDKGLADAVGRLLEGEEGVTRHPTKPAYWNIAIKPTKLKGGTTTGRANLAVAVSGGRLLVANQAGLLAKVLAGPAAPLAKSADFLAVDAQLRKLAPAESSFRIFARPAEVLRGPYVLTQSDRLGGAGGLTARLLRGGLHQLNVKPDAGKLPPYDKVGRYLTPLGAAVVTAPNHDGWDAVGFLLKAPR